MTTLPSSAWEHEGGLGGEMFRLADIAAVGTCVDWAMVYLQACKYLGEKTRSLRDPDELLNDINTRSTKLQDYYNKMDIDLSLQSQRRICYIKGAHLKIDDPVLYPVDYSKIIMPKSNMVYRNAVIISMSTTYYYSGYDFFKFLGEGDPVVLSRQLVYSNMLSDMRDYYCERGTEEYNNFFYADNLEKLMLLNNLGTPESFLVCYNCRW